MSDNLLVRNKADHYPYYAYDDGWLDGRGVTEEYRPWDSTLDTPTAKCDFSCELAPGTYTLTAECDGPDTYRSERVRIHNGRGTTYSCEFPAGAGIAQPATFTVTDETAGTWYVVGKRRGARWRVALFAGDTPAAWAPYSGETLAGGGALMSANLLDGIKPQLNNGTAEDGGAWHVKQTAGYAGLLTWKISGQAALATNQTVHLGISAKAASGSTGTFSLVVIYMDKAGNRNWTWTTWISPTASWSRFEASATIPSGMTIYALALSVPAGKKSPEAWVTAPTMSYGSPVCLASSAHTPYATQDHVSVTYATKASLKVTDDSIKAEVSARAQTDQNVADLSSRLTQTADGIRDEVARKVSVGGGGTVTDLSSVMEQSADGVLFKFSKTVGGATYQPAIELTTDTDYDDGRTVNSAIKMWESMSARAGGGDPVTEINGSTMRINKVVLVESLRVGGWVLRAVSDSSDGSELIEIRSV